MSKAEEISAFQDPLPLPKVIKIDPTQSELKIHLQAAQIQIHQKVPLTDCWTYEGSFPGPTIEVDRDQSVQVQWQNQIEGKLPFTVVTTDTDLSQNTAGWSRPQNGIETDKEQHQVEDLTAWTIVHLHGGHTQPDSDGWSENAVLTGQTQFATYSNQQRSSMIWYHDHAMDITRYNVFSGLAGMWIIRDPEEANLNLPSGDAEIPLMIRDCNLDTDEQGNLTGRLLHKTETNTPEFFGPYTLVNGTIWPYHPVAAKHYRLRLVNASNARTYCLKLVDDGDRDVTHLVKQIGTDGGLLAAPVDLPNGLIISPAERADLIVDFSQHQGQQLRLVNIAIAPFQNAFIELADIGTSKAVDSRLPHPEVMAFQVENAAVVDTFTLPTQLSDFHRWEHPQPGKPVETGGFPAEHEHRSIALVESKETKMLNLLEMLEVNPLDAMELNRHETIIELREDQTDPDRPTYYRVGAKNFRDTINFDAKLGGYEIWKILNLTGDTHPFHVHLVQCQILSRRRYDINGAEIDWVQGTPNKPVRMLLDAHNQQITAPIDPNEQGWKDTVRVNPGELLSIAMQFTDYTGRYLYHCHVIEHEDNQMMRPFTISVPAIMDIMPHLHGGSSHHH